MALFFERQYYTELALREPAARSLAFYVRPLRVVVGHKRRHEIHDMPLPKDYEFEQALVLDREEELLPREKATLVTPASRLFRQPLENQFRVGVQ